MIENQLLIYAVNKETINWLNLSNNRVRLNLCYVEFRNLTLNSKETLFQLFLCLQQLKAVTKLLFNIF